MTHWPKCSPLAFLWLMLLAACRPSVVPLDRIKILVSSDAVYRVTAAALEKLHADVNSIDPATLQLFHDDCELAIRVSGKGSSLNIDFFGQPSDSPYSRFSTYWLVWGGQAGKRMRQETPRLFDGVARRTFVDAMHLTRPSLFFPLPGDLAQSWFWQTLTAPATSTIPITLDEAVPELAHLGINVYGRNQDPADPDHHLRVFLNDVQITDKAWDGQGSRTIDAAIPASVIRPGQNTLRLVAPGDTKAAADLVLLSSIDITYTRALVAGPAQLEFLAERGSYQLEGRGGKALELFNVTDPDEPVHLSDTGATPGKALLTVADEEPQRWLALPSDGYRTPEQILPMPRTDVRQRTRQAEYIIITHPSFWDAVKPLAQWRAQRGQVAVVTTDEVYDEFSYGSESPFALRAFLDSVKPRFVLLVGKATFDYRNYLGGSNKNLLPTFLVETPHLHQAASDDWFAAGPHSPVPTFAIGRIPAKTSEEVSRVVGKIIAYESKDVGQDWRSRGIFVADDKERIFESLSDSLASKSSRRIRADKIYLAARQGNIETTRAELVDKWNQGALLVTYVGHGSLDTWAEGPLFSSENVNEIQNTDRLPILVTPTCLDGFFYHTDKDSLAEDLLFSDHGGIIAGIVPTGLTTPEAQGDLMQALFAGIFQDSKPTLGDALVDAKSKLDLMLPDTTEVSQTFVLLGDPALGLSGF